MIHSTLLSSLDTPAYNASSPTHESHTPHAARKRADNDKTTAARIQLASGANAVPLGRRHRHTSGLNQKRSMTIVLPPAEPDWTDDMAVDDADIDILGQQLESTSLSKNTNVAPIPDPNMKQDDTLRSSTQLPSSKTIDTGKSMSGISLSAAHYEPRTPKRYSGFSCDTLAFANYESVARRRAHRRCRSEDLTLDDRTMLLLAHSRDLRHRRKMKRRIARMEGEGSAMCGVVQERMGGGLGGDGQWLLSSP